ncbi:hypothetical protein DUNSADRAFT_11539, partial [Dunaliella salina]
MLASMQMQPACRYAGPCSTSGNPPGGALPPIGVSSLRNRAARRSGDAANSRRLQRISPCSSEGNGESSSTSSGTLPPSAWTREELESLNEEVEQSKDAELGEIWRSDFAQDLDGLYDYVGAATAEWQQVVHDLYKLPQNEWQ